MHNATESVRAHFDERATGYEAKYASPRSIFELEKIRRAELLIEHARRLRPEFVLDAGSGPGIALARLRAGLPGARFAAVDLSASMLRQARRNNPEQTQIIQALVDALPFREAGFDFVYALGVIDYLPDPSRFFDSVHRVLAPGGSFVFSYPNKSGLNRRLRGGLRRLVRGPRQVSGVAASERDIRASLAAHGLALVEQDYITYGNGIVALPWSLSSSRALEGVCRRSAAGRMLAWSCLCRARKAP